MSGRTLADRIAALEVELGTLDQEWQALPDFIDARLRVTDARIARLAGDVAILRRDLSVVIERIEDIAAARKRGGAAARRSDDPA